MRRNILKIIALISVLYLIIATFAGCNQKVQTVKYELPQNMEIMQSGVFASNKNFALEWEDNSKTILLHSKASGKIWSTTPYDLYSEEKFNAITSSPVSIEVTDTTDRSINTVHSYSACIQNNTISVSSIENGIEVIYYFDDLEISIPVSYVLREDSLAITIDNDRIAENDRFKLLSVSVAPMLCSTINDAENSYMFVPLGTGALMSTKLTVDGTRYFSAEVYGEDIAQTLIERLVDKENIKLPVFGIRDGNSALFAIIENNAGGVTIKANGGDKITKHSNVYACIYTRGTDKYKTQGIETSSITTITSDNKASAKTTIGYYPLENENADYNGMAKCYKEYLIKNGMKKSDTAQKAYALSVIGNIENKQLKLGIPVTQLNSITNYNETLQIVEELGNGLNTYPAVQLLGYGNSGTNAGKIAGGLKLSDKSGSKKDFKKLNDFLKTNSSPLFVEFEMVFYSKSGSGISTLNDAAKSATMRKSLLYNNIVALGDYDKSSGKHYLIKQSKILDVIPKLVDKSNRYGINGYSFSTLASVAYSDYTNTNTSVKAGIEDIASKAFSYVKSNNSAIIAGNDANAYAAKILDSIFDVQVIGENTDGIDAYIPFYQMVFKGYIPMYSEYVNSASDREEIILSSLESGVGLGYILSKNYDISYVSKYQRDLYSSRYDLQKDYIITEVNKYSKYYEKIANAEIISFRILKNGVSETVFNNGITAYTNKTESTLTTPIGSIEGRSFQFAEKGGIDVE